MKKKLFLTALVMLIICIAACGCITQNVTEEVKLENSNFAFEKVVSSVIESTVTITCQNESGGTSGGAGVIVTSDGYIVTNYHVVRGDNDGKANVVITSANGVNAYYTATILPEINDNTDFAKMDLAVLKINSVAGVHFKPVTFKQNEVTWGEFGVMIGNPKQLGSLCAHAMVSNPKKTIQHKIKYTHNVDCIVLDAPVNPGNSGGGFFDASGNLAGIVTLRQYDDSSANQNVTFGIAYAIPSQTVYNYLQRYTQIKLEA